MNIKKSSILDISSDFDLFISNLQDVNYVVWTDARSFNFKGSPNFSINDLRLLFSDVEDPVSGKMTLEKYDFIKNKISLYFSYKDDESGSPCKIQDHTLAQARSEIFWNLITKHVSFPIKIAYIHESEPGSYFDDWTFWGICFVLIDDNNRGIALGAGSWP